MKVFSKRKWQAVTQFSYTPNWVDKCDGKSIDELNTMGYRIIEKWCEEQPSDINRTIPKNQLMVAYQMSLTYWKGEIGILSYKEIIDVCAEIANNSGVDPYILGDLLKACCKNDNCRENQSFDDIVNILKVLEWSVE